ncbi:MAG: serine hydrolase [Ginsengibacter sp.]
MLFLQVPFAQKGFSKADDWLRNHLSELGGRAVLVLKNGKIIHKKAENNLSRKQKTIGKFIAKRQGKDAEEMLQDYTITTHERIASSSKWLSAALVMTFVEEGKLNLDDTVGKFLPTLTLHKKGNIQIWQCLSHLTAIKPASLKQSLQEMKNVSSMDEAIEKIAVLPMEGEPGKVFHFSNTGLQIAGAIIEKISGKSFETLFKERIAIPCNMINTDFGKGKVALPAGGAYSTPEDYVHFLQMILQNGNYNGKQVLSKESVVKMQYNYAKNATVAYSPAEAGSWGYGLGEWVMDDATSRSGAVTSPGLFGSFPWVDNERQYAGFLFVFNLKQKGRYENYKELKSIIDKEIDGH